MIRRTPIDSELSFWGFNVGSKSDLGFHVVVKLKKLMGPASDWVTGAQHHQPGAHPRQQLAWFCWAQWDLSWGGPV